MVSRIMSVAVVVLLVGAAIGAATVAWSLAGDRPAASARSDFNGDGIGDLAVGVPLENVGSVADAGAVNVVYGSPTGLSALSNQFWNQNSTNVEDRSETDDYFGSALASGDFNGDGFADLAVGASGESVGLAADAGAVNVLYGAPGGLSATFVPDQFWTQDSPNVEDTAEQGDEFGNALASADFNADGFADLAIGVLHESVGVAADAGAVNVLYGSPSGLSATFVPDQLWTQDSPLILDGAEAGDEFGTSLAAADLGNGSPSDLAIGVWLEDVGPLADAGAVNVLYGVNGSGLTAVNNQFWTQDSPNVADMAEPSDEFGFALAAADFGNGAVADLAIGVPGENILTRPGNVIDAGAVNVLYGTSSGLSADGDQFWSQNSANVEDASETSDSFGQSLAAANFGHDGLADLAIGVPLEGIGTASQAGAVNVIYGSGTGLSATTYPDQFWSQDSPNVEDTAESFDLAGWSVTAVNFGNSIESDLGIGVLLEDVDTASGTVTDAGAANVIYGSPLAGLSATTFPDQFWSQDNTSGVAQTSDHFGWRLGT